MDNGERGCHPCDAPHLDGFLIVGVLDSTECCLAFGATGTVHLRPPLDIEQQSWDVMGTSSMALHRLPLNLMVTNNAAHYGQPLDSMGTASIELHRQPLDVMGTSRTAHHGLRGQVMGTVIAVIVAITLT